MREIKQTDLKEWTSFSDELVTVTLANRVGDRSKQFVLCQCHNDPENSPQMHAWPITSEQRSMISDLIQDAKHRPDNQNIKELLDYLFFEIKGPCVAKRFAVV